MFVADTDLISELRKKRPNPKVLQWLRDHDDKLFLTAIPSNDKLPNFPKVLP